MDEFDFDFDTVKKTRSFLPSAFLSDRMGGKSKINKIKDVHIKIR